jgi:uncharacterized protein with ParB-like and HNH nuclease domain
MMEDIGSMYDLRFNINYYGADYPIDALVRKMDREEIYIPKFQRQYVWSVKEASLFIESILLGLPVPSIFLAKDKYTNRLLIIDGQQRLKTLQYYIHGYFPDKKPFKLKGVIPQFNGLAFHDLDSKDQYNLKDFTIHATVIAESGDSNRMYYLFERLNTTGTPLTPQEIRNAIYHGEFNDLIQSLATQEIWSKLYGKYDKRLKDQELILRFFALHFKFEEYKGNMKDFLNEFMLKNRTLDRINGNLLSETFNKTIDTIYKSIGPEPFKLNRVFNTAFYDVVMLIVSWNLNKLDKSIISSWHNRLRDDLIFKEYLRSRTTSRESIHRRIDYAKSVLSNI